MASNVLAIVSLVVALAVGVVLALDIVGIIPSMNSVTQSTPATTTPQPNTTPVPITTSETGSASTDTLVNTTLTPTTSSIVKTPLTNGKTMYVYTVTGTSTATDVTKPVSFNFKLGLGVTGLVSKVILPSATVSGQTVDLQTKGIAYTSADTFKVYFQPAVALTSYTAIITLIQ